MFFIKSAFCRVFQLVFHMALPILPYREPEIVNSCNDIGSILRKKNINSVLIVTDKGIVNNGIVLPIEKSLQESNIKYSIYDKTNPNPTVDNVEEALLVYKANNCNGLIAVGGGSPMDCAKAVGARVVYPKKTVGNMKGIFRVLRKLPTLIAIPTTAGTGSEVTLASIISDSEKQHKYAIMSFSLIPHYAVLDASLTYSLPQHLTATTGMDALTHAVEAYIGRSTTKETRRLALLAVKQIFSNIEKAYIDGKNHNARKSMLQASYYAGIAFSKSYVGYIHAIAHSLGGQYGIPHGLANAVIMPHMLETYGKSVYKKLYMLGINVGVCDKSDSYEVGAHKFIEAIKKLNKDMGIPQKIDGIKKEDIFLMAKHAEKEANPLYPVPKLMTKKELEKIYYKIANLNEEK